MASFHGKARENVCCLCFCSKGQKASRKITEALEKKLRRSFPAYNSNDKRFATGLCMSCQRILTSQETHKPHRILLEAEASLQPVTIRPRTRSESQIGCNCKICHIASLNGNEWKRYISKKDPKRYCPRCGAEIYRGSNHSQETCEEQVLKNLTAVVEDKEFERDAEGDAFVKLYNVGLQKLEEQSDQSIKEL